MKNFKKLIAKIMVFVITITFFSSIEIPSVEASKKISEKESFSSGYYYIKCKNSGKYLDVKDGSMENGATLQIWERYPMHQNQVFRIVHDDTGVGGYKIIAWQSKKVIEVRDSSNDDGADIAQWDDCNLLTQRWKIIFNSDGSVSFRNKNSKKYMDVYGNYTSNGTTIQQYRKNNTTAQKFYLYKASNKDILNAVFKTNLSSKIEYAAFSKNDRVFNATEFDTQFSGNTKYLPAPGRKYLYSVEYIDSATKTELLKQGSLPSSILEDIGDLLEGNFNESVAQALLKTIGFSEKILSVLGSTIGVLGVVQILDSQKSKKDWAKFVNAVEKGNGIIKYTYITITPTGGKYGVFFKQIESYEYEVWSGNGNVEQPSGYDSTCIKLGFK